MPRYAIRAVAWRVVLAASCLVLLLMELVRHWLGPSWTLQGVAVAVVAAAVAWSLDEPAAQIVDTTPRSLAWRTLARSGAVALLVGVWLVAVNRVSAIGHVGVLRTQGVAAALLAAGWTTWCRSRGSAAPGSRFALLIIPTSLAHAFATPRLHLVAVFPTPWTSSIQWTDSLRWWLAAGALGCVLLAAALTDARWWVHRR